MFHRFRKRMFMIHESLISKLNVEEKMLTNLIDIQTFTYGFEIKPIRDIKNKH